MSNTDGGPAFPVDVDQCLDKSMSLRDWFAGQALAGLLADPKVNPRYEKAAMVAFKFADAMLAARGGDE